MTQDFQLSTDRGLAVDNGRYGTVTGAAFIRQHITLAVLDVLATQRYGRLTDELYVDIRTALERRLQNHAQVETLERITFDRDAGPNTLKGEIVTDAVAVPFEEDL